MAILLMVIVAGIWFNTDKSGTRPLRVSGENETVRLAVAKALITAPVLLALHKDYFAEEGLSVIIAGEFSSGKESFDLMLSGKADISTPATTPVVFSSFERQDYSIFATYLTTYNGIKIIGRVDRGVNSATDLKQKNIGIVNGTISQILVDTFLAYNKILLSEVNRIGFKGHELPMALSAGTVDVISVWEPHADKALQLLDGNGIQISSAQVYRIAINMAVMNDFAEKNPTVLEKIVRGLIRANAFIRDHKQQSQNIMSEILKMDKRLIAASWEDLSFAVTLDQLLLVTMENEAKWALKNRFQNTRKIPNYLNYINYKAMESVNPELITIIRDAQ